ncbi:MAG: hypothetical protein HQK84_11760 [Nitrospinae bacterium]|nr:hypothetical protein [Nitrospinota bacterium]
MSLHILLILICFYGVLKFSDIMIVSTQVFGLRNPKYQNFTGYTLGALTSVPELVITIASIATGNPEIAVMNIISSNIINAIFLTIQSWRFQRLRHFRNKYLWDEIAIALIAIILPTSLFFSGDSHIINATVGVLLFISFVLWEKYGMRKFSLTIEEPTGSGWFFNTISLLGKNNVRIIFLIVFGCCGLTVSGFYMGNSLDYIMVHTKETIPFLAIVIGIFAGIGTSIPEYKSFGAIYKLYKEAGEKFSLADIQSCLDNNNASSCFNYGIIYPIGVYGGKFFSVL